MFVNNSIAHSSLSSVTDWVDHFLLILWKPSKENFSNLVHDQSSNESNAQPPLDDKPLGISPLMNKAMTPIRDSLERLAFNPIQLPDWPLSLEG
jgi:hypothetical protein